MLVLQLRLDAEYVLDSMTFDEVDILLKYSHYADKVSWEQARLTQYVNVQMNSKKKIKPSDLYEFAWEKNKQTKQTTLAERERLIQKAKREAMNMKINDENING